MTATVPEPDSPLRGRRITADEFYKITGRRLKAANDDIPADQAPADKDAP